MIDEDIACSRNTCQYCNGSLIMDNYGEVVCEQCGIVYGNDPLKKEDNESKDIYPVSSMQFGHNLGSVFDHNSGYNKLAKIQNSLLSKSEDKHTKHVLTMYRKCIISFNYSPDHCQCLANILRNKVKNLKLLSNETGAKITNDMLERMFKRTVINYLFKNLVFAKNININALDINTKVKSKNGVKPGTRRGRYRPRKRYEKYCKICKNKFDERSARQHHLKHHSNRKEMTYTTFLKYVKFKNGGKSEFPASENNSSYIFNLNRCAKCGWKDGRWTYNKKKYRYFLHAIRTPYGTIYRQSCSSAFELQSISSQFKDLS